MDAKCFWFPSTSATDGKQEEGRAIIQANRSECNIRRNHIVTRHQWRYGIFFSAWHSCLPQVGCPNIRVKSISATASTSAVVFWRSATIKVITSGNASSLGMKQVYIIMKQTPNGRACNGNKKSKSHPSASRLLLTVFWDFQGPILDIWIDITVISVNCCDRLRGWQFAQNWEEGCHSVFWYMTGYTSPSATFSDWIGKYSNTLPTVKTWPPPISICLICQECCKRLICRWWVEGSSVWPTS